MNDLLDNFMDDTEPEHISFFGWLRSFFKRNKEASVQLPEYYSIFMKYLEGIDESNSCYAPLRQTIGLCEDALRVVKQRMILSKKIFDIDNKIQELECFNLLSEEEVDYLKNMLSRFTSLSTERNVLLNQITSFDKHISDMDMLETQAASAVSNIHDAERSQRILRHDIGYLQGEKTDLEFERGALENGLEFINKFTVAMIGLFVFISFFLGYLYMFRNTPIFFPSSILVIALIIVSSLIYAFRRRTVYELQLNVKKQQKAMGMINKKNVVFSYYTNFLKFSYGKYKVKSSQMLKKNLDDLNNYKHLAGRIDAIRKIMYETEEEIEKFLREKNLVNFKSSIETFAKTISIDDKKKYYAELNSIKLRHEKELLSFDSRHEEIWDMLVTLSEYDGVSSNKNIKMVIQAYLDEVGRILQQTEKI